MAPTQNRHQARYDAITALAQIARRMRPAHPDCALATSLIACIAVGTDAADGLAAGHLARSEDGREFLSTHAPQALDFLDAETERRAAEETALQRAQRRPRRIFDDEPTEPGLDEHPSWAHSGYINAAEY